MTASHGSSFFVGPHDTPDKYRLLQQVGRGGEAQLWQAELSVAGGAEPVAIKMRLQTDGDFDRSSQRWSEQAELLRFVGHPGVVGVREHFEGAPFHPRGAADAGAEHALFLVMNWVDGLPLHEWAMLNREAPDRLPRVLRHLEQVADVLDWLHSGQATPSRRPVIHGDLSPGNVMITPSGQAMLVDFGLVRVVSHRTGQAAGTPGYTAPEVWHSGEYSPASDRYSFGALAYFGLTGVPPTQNVAEIHATLAAHPLVAAARPGVLDQLMAIFNDRPEHRPPSAADWMRLLRSTAMTGTVPPSTQTAVIGAAAPPPTDVRPVMGPPDPGWSSPPPRPKRRVGLVVGAVAAVALLVGGVVLGVQLAKDSDQASPPSPTVVAQPTTDPVVPFTTTPEAAPSTTDPDFPGGPTGENLPGAPVTVRHDGSITIALDGNDVDLDSPASDPQWQTGDRDLYFYHSSTKNLVFTGPVIRVSTPADYTSCRTTTGYRQGAYDVADLTPGEYFCVKTGEQRYSAVKLTGIQSDSVTIDVKTFDSPGN